MISNSWVIDGSRTASGKANIALEVLADIQDDPIFQTSSLQFGGNEVTGSAFLGIPGIFNGRSKTSAWSQTSAMQQNTANLYLEYLSEDQT